MGFFSRKKKSKKPQTKYEYDRNGKKIAVVDYLPSGKKVRVDLRKKEAQLRQRGIPFILDDRRNAPMMQLLKEIHQYRFMISSVPLDLKREIIRRVDSSFELIDIEFIGGEGVTFGVKDLGSQKLAVKIALPFEQAAGQRTIEEIEIEEADIKRKQVLIQDINDSKRRFTDGGTLQNEVAELLQDEGVTWFGVPSCKISADPVLHLVMPWIHGPCLIKRDNRELRYTLEKYGQILDAVAYLHEFGIIHRDLKGENIIIGQRAGRECIYLVDWTLAKRAGNRNLTVPGIGVGTLGNASPKQMALFDAVNATFVDDIWSLGLLLYEIIYCKKVPQMIRRADFFDLEKLALYVARLAEFIPSSLRGVFLKATKINEEERFQSVKAMKSAFVAAMQTMDFDTTKEFIDVGAVQTDVLHEELEGTQTQEEAPVRETEGEVKEIVFVCCQRGICAKYNVCLKKLEFLEAMRKAGLL